MRSTTLAELALLARVLMKARPKDQLSLAVKTLAEVDEAAAHLRFSGRCDPRFGDGSLMSRCLALVPASEPLAEDREFLSALIIVCEALRDHSRM